MLREEVESSTSARRRNGKRGVMLDSPAIGAPLRTRTKDPPPYGAQHRQDALWKGGNKALPPRWQQLKLLNDEPMYQDDTLTMVSSNRPLPGVRLDEREQLVPGCEWHISPLGRSYFVNHNTQTTSWAKPKPERPPGSLTPECVIEGRSECIWSLICLGTNCNIMGASGDGSIRQWTRDGEPVGRPWNGDGGSVPSIAVHPDETMVVSGSEDGRLRLWNIGKGSTVGDPWEGHNALVRCLDWSSDALEIASGSQDGTIRRWNPNTGRQIAIPIETGHGWVYTVKYSPQCDKFTSGGFDSKICVWSKGGELLIEIQGHNSDVGSLCWSKDGAHIFSGSGDGTIRKWRSIDGEELVVIRGHTNMVRSLCLLPDESHLVSASRDRSVRIWDLKTNQQVGDPLLHDDEIITVVVSPDGKYIATAAFDAKVYLWSVEAALRRQSGDQVASDVKRKGRAVPSRDMFVTPRIPGQKAKNGLARYGEDFWGNGTSPSAPLAGPTAPLRSRSFFNSLRFSPRPANVPQSIPLEPRRWNFSLFPGGRSIRTVDVAPGRKKDRIAIAPPTAAELAKAELAAATQHASGNEAASSPQRGQPAPGTQASQGRPTETNAAIHRMSSNEPGSSMQQGQPAPGTQVSQGRPTETQGSSGGMGEVSYGVRCCGLFFSCGRPTSYQS